LLVSAVNINDAELETILAKIEAGFQRVDFLEVD
jgi:hypothetical protein